MFLSGRSFASLIGFAGLLCLSASASAQSMMGAPGLSPVAPGVGAASPAPPAALTVPQAAAPASICETDMAGFQERRQTQIEALNKIVAAGKGKVDPIASCPKLRSLVSVEGEMRAWMIKQKSWCNIPDEVIEGMKAGTAKTAEIAERACEAAAQMKRQQQQPAMGAAPAMKLPAGPL